MVSALSAGSALPFADFILARDSHLPMRLPSTARIEGELNALRRIRGRAYLRAKFDNPEPDPRTRLRLFTNSDRQFKLDWTQLKLEIRALASVHRCGEFRSELANQLG
jgi:hypothetical protein